MIIFVQMEQGFVFVYIVDPCMDTPYFADWIMAFCSACSPLHNSCLCPDGTFSFALKHPTSEQ